MKKIISFFFFLSLVFLWSCKKDNYPGASISPYVSIFDIRNIYKGQDVTLTKENMFGSNTIAGIVVSDHSGGNLPPGLLVIQDGRRLSKTRGISISIGSEAANYKPGDSVHVHVEGAVLKRVDGILQITGISPQTITTISSGNPVPVPRVPVSSIIAHPNDYESTLSVIVKGGFDPLPAPTDVLAGDKLLNDGFGDIILHTEANATFANKNLAFTANYFGIVFNTAGPKEGELVPQFRIRTENDVVVLSSTIEITPIIITGFMSDVAGVDSNYEYMQFMATRDIDFSVTPFSVVTTNNAGNSSPTGYPANGWATGGKRTYKFDLTSGRAAKGTFFYVGGDTTLINGEESTNIASTSNWITNYNYGIKDGAGFGTRTTNLLANSGNAFGIAVFEGTTVTADSKPVDVIFIATGGNLYTAGPPAKGYRITNTDFYDVINPVTLKNQPYYRSGSNTLCFGYYVSNRGYFNRLGGVYNATLGKWVKARTQTNVLLTKSSTVTEIEGEGSTMLK